MSSSRRFQRIRSFRSPVDTDIQEVDVWQLFNWETGIQGLIPRSLTAVFVYDTTWCGPPSEAWEQSHVVAISCDPRLKAAGHAGVPMVYHWESYWP